MRKVVLLSLGLFLMSATASFSQSFMDYVSEVRGDTAVVKDYLDMDLLPNSLNNAITNDAEAPAGRVYELKTNGWYPQSAGVTTPTSRPVVIAGADKTILVNNKDANKVPPIISGYTDESGSQIGGINYASNLTVKNISQIVGAPDGTQGWAFYGDAAAGVKVTFDNCMMERNWWVFIQSNGHADNSFFIKNCYFVNMSGRACRRNGGIYDNVNNNTDTMYVENNTHVMAQGMMYKFRNYPVKFIYLNHNTFINCVGTLIETQGYQSNQAVVNNIFVNSNCQPFRKNMTEDMGEQDAGQEPTGIIDVLALPDSMEQVDRKFLAQNNLLYMDPKLADLASAANAINAGGHNTWVNQSITMNARTQGYFNDNAKYPYLSEANWYTKLPTFAKPENLLTTIVDSLKQYCLQAIDTTSTKTLVIWRLVNTSLPDQYIYSDWPIPVDLSYTDTDLTGTDGLPIGDLNWFPAKKADFISKHAKYYGDIVTALATGKLVTGVEEIGGTIPESFKLSQNYPNPFNPTTVIDFTLPKAGNVTLKVYNTIGQEVATLVNGYKEANNYKVSFNASNLASGVYIYKLEGNNFSLSRKMMLLK